MKINHRRRMKELYKEHGDMGVKLYMAETVNEAGWRVEKFNSNDNI